MGRRWILSAAAVAVVLAAVASPATAAGAPVYGASLGPSPLILEDWTSPTLYVANIGRVPIDATVTIAGAGYSLGSPASFRAIAPGAQVEVPLVSAGKGTALATAHVSPADPVAGQDTALLAVNVHVRHLSPLEEAERSLAPYAGLLALGLLALAGLLALVHRRRRAAS